MARFLTDADIPVRLGVLVGSGGHDVLRAYHAGVAHAGDDEVLVTAARLGRILITPMRDIARFSTARGCAGRQPGDSRRPRSTPAS
jgi:predicted nuclease of predicted toxin-antitoxin system